ncbi:outer membrane protein assembly factor BamC [Corticimicrobacter populi]|nr:outer membrane protein assembly factor BamC [Corticimicrobacter populi]
MNKRYTGLSALVGLALLSGCSQVNELLGTEDSIDYKSTASAPRETLSIPPDLTQAASDPRYRAPASGSTTFSEYAQGQTQLAQEQQQAPTATTVLPQRDDIRIMRDGDMRWLVVQRPVESIFPEVGDFWVEQGFTLAINDPNIGVVETDWAENRAKVPEGWLRNMLGRVLDSVFDSGERERFRTRLERMPDGSTEIYISHRQMREQLSKDGSNVMWQMADEDPGLNAVMLARLMVQLGTDQERARAMVEAAESRNTPARAQVQEVSGGDPVLVLSDSFDQAWRRVGLALDQASFAVEDRNRSTGEYYMRYNDTDTGAGDDKPGFFGRLFGGSDPSKEPVYRLVLKSDQGRTTVSVLDPNGQPDQSATARRMLSVLADSLR